MLAPFSLRADIVEVDQIDVAAAAVPCHLEQVDDPQESRTPRQIAGDVGKRDRLDRVDDDVPVFHRIDAADLDVRPLPNPHAAGDPALAHAGAKALREHHWPCPFMKGANVTNLPTNNPSGDSSGRHLMLERLTALDGRVQRGRRSRLASYAPYPRQAEFHAAGAGHRERLLMACNQFGKTLAGSME